MKYEDDIENAVLGCLLLKPELMKRIIVQEEHFTTTSNKKIFEIFKTQFNEYQTISVIGISENYKNHFKNEKEINDFVIKVTSLMDDNILPSQFDYYQETLLKKLSENRMIEEITKFQNNQISQEELLDEIHKIERENLKTKKTILSGDDIYRLISMQNKRINFKFTKLCNYSNIQEHDLVIIAARPGIGKTGFALNLLEDLSRSYNCVLFNMEMTEQQVYRRLVAINSGVPMMFHDKPETDYQKQTILNACNDISKQKIQIVTGGQTIRTLKNKIIKESSKEHTIFFIDYVTLIKKTDRNKSLYEHITEITKELRQISLEYDCTIFCLAQINRNSEREKDKRPKISDLKESGELEQSATTVLMIHNEGYYKNATKEKEEIEIIIGKNRNGVTGIIDFYYNTKNQRFEEKRSY